MSFEATAEKLADALNRYVDYMEAHPAANQPVISEAETAKTHVEDLAKASKPKPETSKAPEAKEDPPAETAADARAEVTDQQLIAAAVAHAKKYDKAAVGAIMEEFGIKGKIFNAKGAETRQALLERLSG